MESTQWNNFKQLLAMLPFIIVPWNGNGTTYQNAKRGVFEA